MFKLIRKNPTILDYTYSRTYHDIQWSSSWSTRKFKDLEVDTQRAKILAVVPPQNGDLVLVRTSRTIGIYEIDEIVPYRYNGSKNGPPDSYSATFTRCGEFTDGEMIIYSGYGIEDSILPEIKTPWRYIFWLTFIIIGLTLMLIGVK